MRASGVAAHVLNMGVAKPLRLIAIGNSTSVVALMELAQVR
jgi:hypothetical protein